jgi:hypothetical protein
MNDALAAIERLAEGRRRIRDEIRKVIVGQDDVIDETVFPGLRRRS